MSDEVLEKVRNVVAELVALDPSEVHADSRLMEDLGADSLDLVEMIYLLEQELGVRLDRNDLSLSAQLGIPEDQLHHNEVLTPRALELLRERFPAAGALLQAGVVRKQLAQLLTVEEVARSVRRKLEG